MGKILVVEDEVYTNLCKNLLETLGHKVRTASNSGEFTQALREEKFDLIITDLRIPFMDGLECIQMIRRDNPKIGIIIITGDLSLSEQDMVKKIAHRVLPKPFNAMDLQGAVETYFGKGNQ